MNSTNENKSGKMEHAKDVFAELQNLVGDMWSMAVNRDISNAEYESVTKESNRAHELIASLRSQLSAAQKKAEWVTARGFEMIKLIEWSAQYCQTRDGKQHCKDVADELRTLLASEGKE